MNVQVLETKSDYDQAVSEYSKLYEASRKGSLSAAEFLRMSELRAKIKAWMRAHPELLDSVPDTLH